MAERSRVGFQHAFRDSGNALLDFLDREVLVQAAGLDGGYRYHALLPIGKGDVDPHQRACLVSIQ
jgi:hypothetical protein